MRDREDAAAVVAVKKASGDAAVLADHGHRGPGPAGRVRLRRGRPTSTPASQRAGAAATATRRARGGRGPGPLRARELHPGAGAASDPGGRRGPARPAKLVDQASGCSTWPRTCRRSSWCPTSSTSPTWPGPTRRTTTSCRAARRGSHRRRHRRLPRRTPAPAGLDPVGCARSRSIHEWFYGELPAQVVTSARGSSSPTTGGPAHQVLPARGPHRGRRRQRGRAVGRLADQVRQALTDLATMAEPAWAPASPTPSCTPTCGAPPSCGPVFDERARLQTWLDILAALARAQAKVGIIPAQSADADHRDGRGRRPRPRRRGRRDPADSHSTLGLIHALQQVLPSPARDHVYVGATVQDVTDTWTALAMREVGQVVWRDLRAIEDLLLDLADAIATRSWPGGPTASPARRSPSASRRRRGPTRCAATSTASPRGGRAGWSASSGAPSASSGTSAPTVPRCGPRSAPSWGWATRPSRG